MGRKRTRFYEREILQILEKNGGFIWGFNQLLGKGNFHRNTLQRCLESMNGSGQITIEGDHRKKKYCISTEDLEKEFRRTYKGIVVLEDEIKNTKTESGEKITQTIHLIDKILDERNKIELLIFLTRGIFDLVKNRGRLETTRTWLTKKLENHLVKLSSQEKAKILKLLKAKKQPL